MHGCQGCQERMLEYLYDLLEGDERQALEVHLASCADCQRCLEKVRGQQKLLAVAARLEFPAVRFVPPGAEAPATLPLPPVSPVRRVRRLSWRRWATAAAVLLALGGLGAAGAWLDRDYTLARQAVERQEQAVADARQRLEEAARGIEKAAEERDQRLEEVRQEGQARELRMVVSGPRTVEVGAPAEFQVRTYDLNGRPASARVLARLVDAGKALKESKPAAPVAPRTEPAASRAMDSGGKAPPLSTARGGSGPSAGGTASTAATAPAPGPVPPPPAALTPTTGHPASPAGQPSAPPTEPPAPLTLDDRDEAEPTLPVDRLGDGLYRVTVPPGLRVQPGRQVTMVVSASRDAGATASLREQISLTTPTYITHLATDKPMYLPGEEVYFRSLTLERNSLRPARENFRLLYTLTAPTGVVQPILQGRNALVREEKDRLAEVPGTDGKPVRGIGAGHYPLDSNARGGEYTLTVFEENNRFPPQRRKFVVNTYQKPRLDKKLDFNRPSYGPGDEVQALCQAVRADGGPVKDRPVLAQVQIDASTFGPDGEPTDRPLEFRTDTDGKVVVRFRLPAKIDKGVGTLGVTFDDGSKETIARTIPIVLKKLDVEFFPEGGDLIEGLPNRVYFQARTPAGKPAELKGTLLEDGKETAVTVATLHDDKEPGVNQGNGKFTFTPAPGKKYELRIDSPTGIKERIGLPAAREEGVVLRVDKPVVAPGEPIRVTVLSRKHRTLLVGAYCRGRLLDAGQVGPGQTEAILRPSSPLGGVCRVTVFEELPGEGERRPLKPVAERLIYRHPAGRVDVSITPDKRRYVSGQKATLKFGTTDEKEKLTPALLMVAVVDQSVLTLADEKTARAMPTHFLLTSEVRRPEDLEYADFLLGPQEKAPEALDCLLGTQGWRRFAEQDPAHFRKKLKEEAERMPGEDRRRLEEEGERLLVMIGQSSSRTTDFDKERMEKARAEYEGKRDELLAEHAQAAEVIEEAAHKPEYQAALAVVLRYHSWFDRFDEVGRPLLAVLLVLAAVGLLGVGLARQARGLSWGLALACGVALLLVALLPPVQIEAPRPLSASSNELAILPVPPHPAPDAANEAGEPAEARAAKDAPAREMEALKGPMLGGAGGRAGAPGFLPPGGGGFGGVGGGMPGGYGLMGGPGRAGLMPPDGSRFYDRFADKRAAGEGKDADLALRARMLHNFDVAPRYFETTKADAAFKKEAEKAKDKEAFGRGRGGWAARQAEELRRRALVLRDGKEGRGEDWGALPLVVREYAHRRPSGPSAEMRHDFTETLYWNPVLVLPDGRAEASFDLSDSVTNFQVIAFAHTADGRLGAGTAKVVVRQPVNAVAKLPPEVTASDTLEVPVRVANNTPEALNVTLSVLRKEGLDSLERKEDRGDKGRKETDLKAETAGKKVLEVAADEAAERTFALRPSVARGEAVLELEARTSVFTDRVRQTMKVVPEGFPVTGSQSDLLEGNALHTFELPADRVPGTLTCRVDAYPSTLADLQKGLDALLREPHGCFEQASTSNYPNVLILDYLRESGKVTPAVEKRSRDLLQQGYQKLTSYECQEPGTSKRRGYEWFGGTAPPHEALTAYGLLQFRDMARVQEVDPAMLQRTRAYLLAQRDGKGGFRRNARAIDAFGRAPEHITNAYIVWALTESAGSGGGKEDLSKELNALLVRAKKEKDPYFLSLVALSLVNRGRTKDAVGLLDTVAGLQKEDGHLEGAETSITGSRGRDLSIETTALGVLGWLKANPGRFEPHVRKAVRWIGQQRGGAGGFGSTQSTILALKAVIAHTKANKRKVEAGVLRLYVGEEKLAEAAFPAEATGPLSLEMPTPEKYLKTGSNKVRVEVTGKNVFPHTLTWSYRKRTPASTEGCPVRLETLLARKEVSEGEVVRLTVKLHNNTPVGQGMATAVVGLPAGLSLPEDLKQLRELARVPAEGKPLLGSFEVQGRELVLYWRELGPKQSVEVPIDLIARVPGTYRGPASRGYLYYNADLKHWVEPLEVTVKRR